MPKAQHAQRYRLLPDLLRQMRQEAGLTQRDLAGKLRVSHVSIHKSETGQRRVDVAEFMDWCLACDRNPEEAFHQLREARGLKLAVSRRA